MTLKSTLLPVLVFLNALAFATGPTITPEVSPTAICVGDSFTVVVSTSDTFVTGNVFYVQLSDSTGSFTLGTIIDSLIGQGDDTATFAMGAIAKNSSHYKIRVIASNGTIGLDSTALTIHNTPLVTFQLPQPSYCTYAYTVPLSGGTPVGGTYSGTDVANNAFEAYLSGTGSFDVVYTYTDSIGCSAQANALINITTCPAPSVAVEVSPAAICAGTSINITIQTSSVIGSDNVFTVELSDSTGSFASPTVIATDTSSSGNTIAIPAPVEPAGTHYQVRVVASDPATISVPYNVSFKAHAAAPNVELDTAGPVSLCGRDSFKLSVDSLHGIQYSWTFDGNPITVSKYSYYAKDSGWYKVVFTDTTSAGCAIGSDSVFVGVYANPTKPVVTPHGVLNSCGTSAVDLTTPSVNNITYQWVDHGVNISGATHSSYAADSTGVYSVNAISGGCYSSSDSVYVNILPSPVVTFTLPFDSFCVHSAPIALTGGLPTGGFYSGNYIADIGTFNPDSSGAGAFKVYYTYSDSIGCTGTDSTTIHIYNCTTSGIAELSNKPAVEMFPNPASGNVNIGVNVTGTCKMRLFNLLGQEIGYREFNQQFSYSVEALPAGVYLVEISDFSDSWKTVKRLVVE